MARAVYGVKGDPDYGVDIQNIAGEGQVCEEYKAIVDFIKLGEEIEGVSVYPPVWALASLEDELGVEDMAKGQVVMIWGTRIMIPRGARKRLLALLHETHLGEGSMIATARRL